MTAPPVRVDGRLQRSTRTRAAILEAHATLLRAGHRSPTATQIADAAGVGARTFFQHFPDLESLFAATWDEVMAGVLERVVAVERGWPLTRRVEVLLENRAEIYGWLSPFALSLQAREQVQPALRRRQRDLMTFSLASLADAFDDELATDPGVRELRLYALHTTLSWHAWHNLRDEVGLGRAKTLEVMRHGVLSVLTPCR